MEASGWYLGAIDMQDGKLQQNTKIRVLKTENFPEEDKDNYLYYIDKKTIQKEYYVLLALVLP